MRLRRENGDFNLTITEGAAAISKNLIPEQFVGQIVKDGTDLSVIVTVSGTSGDATYTLTAANDKIYTYTVATGAIATVSTEG